MVVQLEGPLMVRDVQYKKIIIVCMLMISTPLILCLCDAILNFLLEIGRISGTSIRYITEVGICNI